MATPQPNPTKATTLHVEEEECIIKGIEGEVRLLSGSKTFSAAPVSVSVSEPTKDASLFFLHVTS